MVSKTTSITRAKFTFKPTWCFPDGVNHFVDAMISRFDGEWLHAFCGKSTFGNVRVDIDPQNEPDICCDVLDLPDILEGKQFDNIVADPPWKIPNNKRRYFMYALRDCLKVGGHLLINCPWSPWVTGFAYVKDPSVEIWKVAQTFNSYRDLVDWWLLPKISDATNPIGDSK